jgi:hypothetical protein
MKVKDLIARLQAFDPELEVWVQEQGGCNECNPEGIDSYVECDNPCQGEVHVQGYRRPAKQVVTL